MLTVAIPKRNKLQNIIVLTPKDGKRLFYQFLLLFSGNLQRCRLIAAIHDFSSLSEPLFS